MLIKLLLGEAVLTVLSVYAPQTGLEESTKDAFYDSLQTVISELPDKEIVILAETAMDTLDEKQLDMKVLMEVLGMVNVMQMVIESLNLLLQMILSLGILSLSKELFCSYLAQLSFICFLTVCVIFSAMSSSSSNLGKFPLLWKKLEKRPIFNFHVFVN